MFNAVIDDILSVLTIYGYVESTDLHGDRKGYRIDSSVLEWRAARPARARARRMCSSALCMRTSRGYWMAMTALFFNWRGESTRLHAERAPDACQLRAAQWSGTYYVAQPEEMNLSLLQHGPGCDSCISGG